MILLIPFACRESTASLIMGVSSFIEDVGSGLTSSPYGLLIKGNVVVNTPIRPIDSPPIFATAYPATLPANSPIISPFIPV